MKTPHYFLLALFSLTCFRAANAQDEKAPRDSIHYTGNENLDLLILLTDYHDLTRDGLVKEMLTDFQSKLEKIEEDLPKDSPYVIEYSYQQTIEIHQTSLVKSYKISDQTGLVENFKNQAIITDAGKGHQAILSFNDLDDLKTIDLSSVLDGIIAELPGKHRFQRFLEYKTDPSSNKPKLIRDRHTGYMDMLSLKAGVGANVYQNRFLTDISGEIGLHLNQKGILKNQLYISNNLLFSFDANRAVLNNFTNIGYRRNFSNQREKPNWLGAEFGLLTKQNGEIFRENTMRIGMNWDVGKHINVAPQLYFNGFFKQVSPGFRIGIGL
ncbi:hypothetical protein [Negadavirga shengliensis]|uniref:Uncharacterized protein n=1 Tax=Negadavirga shengliensis TaxID=1389218 RepID=A0ABV9T6P9_9BACT